MSDVTPFSQEFLDTVNAQRVVCLKESKIIRQLDGRIMVIPRFTILWTDMEEAEPTEPPSALSPFPVSEFVKTYHFFGQEGSGCLLSHKVALLGREVVVVWDRKWEIVCKRILRHAEKVAKLEKKCSESVSGPETPENGTPKPDSDPPTGPLTGCDGPSYGLR